MELVSNVAVKFEKLSIHTFDGTTGLDDLVKKLANADFTFCFLRI